jgi:hypothetical protein
MPRRMTTSSYAVLALLDLKPWTGYELTNQAQRSLRYAWPKSARLLYSEPKGRGHEPWTPATRIGYTTLQLLVPSARL